MPTPISLSFIVPLSALPVSPLRLQKRPRLSSPSCSIPSLRTLSATTLATFLLCFPTSTYAKTVLSTNTILRRYVATDSSAILRYALPLPSERDPSFPQPPIRRAQELLERFGVDLRARGAAGLIGGRRDLAKLKVVLERERLDLLLDVPAKRRGEAAILLSKMERIVGEMENEIGAGSAGSGIFPAEFDAVGDALREVVERRNSMGKRTNFDAVLLGALRHDALDCISGIEELSVEGIGLPYRIPRRYNALPRLVGRAKVEMKLVKNGKGQWKDQNAKLVGREVAITATLDGFSAPITAGNFVDLAKRGYYNNTPVLAMQRGFFAQLGEREDDDFEGFKDPKTGTRRQLPLEIFVDGDPAPNYGGTLDELGVGDLQPKLPISAYGAMAMVHSVEDSNDASAQFYFFLLDPASSQARSLGGSILTGSLATFGYVDDGMTFLDQLEAGDKVAGIRVIAGNENFRESGDT